MAHCGMVQVVTKGCVAMTTCTVASSTGPGGAAKVLMIGHTDLALGGCFNEVYQFQLLLGCGLRG